VVLVWNVQLIERPMVWGQFAMAAAPFPRYRLDHHYDDSVN
jgi:hypothetical protein